MHRSGKTETSLGEKSPNKHIVTNVTNDYELPVAVSRKDRVLKDENFDVPEAEEASVDAEGDDVVEPA